MGDDSLCGIELRSNFMFELKCKRPWESTPICGVDFHYLMWKCWTSQVLDEYNVLDSLLNCVEQVTYDYVLLSSKNIGFKNKLNFVGSTLVNENEQFKIFVSVVQKKQLYFIIKEIYYYGWCCVMFSMPKCY